MAKRAVLGNKMNSLKWGMLQSQVANVTVSSGECIPGVANVSLKWRMYLLSSKQNNLEWRNEKPQEAK